MPTTPPRYQLLEGSLEAMQVGLNHYAEDGYRVVSMTPLPHGTSHWAQEYCALMEREEVATPLSIASIAAAVGIKHPKSHDKAA